MPAFLKDVAAKVRDRLYPDIELVSEDFEKIVRAAVEVIGLAIANDGEIYSPAPPPPTHDAQQQRNVRWSGGRRRRR